MLYVALVGAFVVGLAIVFQLIQLYVSVRDRKQNMDLTGDPWGGRTLEWSTSSPPPFYNFAKVPVVKDLDEWWEMKRDGRANEVPAKYEKIHMPRNAAEGVIISAFSLVFGFAFIWHIWWLVIFSTAAMLFTVIARSYNSNVDYYVPAEEVTAIENKHLQVKQASQA